MFLSVCSVVSQEERAAAGMWVVMTPIHDAPQGFTIFRRTVRLHLLIDAFNEDNELQIELWLKYDFRRRSKQCSPNYGVANTHVHVLKMRCFAIALYCDMYARC